MYFLSCSEVTLLPSLNEYEGEIKKIAEKWVQTPNVTLLEAVRKILGATDKWRRNHPADEVVEDVLGSIFFLLVTCTKLEHDVNLDEEFSKVCDSMESFSFKDVPKDLVWSFIMYSAEPHVDYSQRREPTAI